MDAWIDAIGRGLVEAEPLDQINLVLGVAGVALMIRRSLWAFPVGLVAVTVQGILFWQWTFYADAKLQVFFFACLTYGWWHWVKHKGNAPELPITPLSRPARLAWLAGASALTLAWGAWQAAHTDAVMPYRDTFIASFSMAAQVLQVRKRLENWVGWVAVNSVAIITYWSAELAYTAFLYAIFLGMGLLGWREWHRAMKAEEARDA